MPVAYGGEGESRQNANLRPVVAALDRQISRLAGGTPTETRTAIGELLLSWAELIELLALGPAPELRQCPVCKHRGMRAATRCGFCWAALVPLTEARDEQLAVTSCDGG